MTQCVAGAVRLPALLNPKQAYYPEREREGGENERTASDRFTYSQPLRTGQLRTPILNPGYRRRDPVGCEIPHGDAYGESYDDS
jgi:hypothetical protein